MFNKTEFFGIVAACLIGGYVIGYNKANEKCLKTAIKWAIKTSKGESYEKTNGQS